MVAFELSVWRVSSMTIKIIMINDDKESLILFFLLLKPVFDIER